MTPEERRIVYATLRWVAICQQSGRLADRNLTVPTNADADHSALLARLLAGRPALGDPPPLSFSAPWYALIEEGRAANVCVERGNYHDFFPGCLLINQTPWRIVSQSGPDEYIVRHAAADDAYRLWRPAQPGVIPAHWGWAMERVAPQEETAR